MRAVLAALLACSGCLIGAPEGATQAWPPVLGLDVQAIVAADLDVNGSSDIVVFGAGDDNEEGMFFIAGGRDLAIGSANPVRSFTRFIPTDYGRPVAAQFVAPNLNVAYIDEVLNVVELSNTLEEQSYGTSSVFASAGTLWTRVVDFPGQRPHVVVSDGSSIVHLEDFAEDRPIPPPMGSPSWNLAQLAMSYASGADQVVVVATLETIVRAVIPTTPGSPFQWETVRSGPAWLGQTTYDFDGDGRDEIVGFDLQAHQVCALDPGAALATPPACAQLTSTFSGSDVTLLVGTNLTLSPGLDILVAQATGSETSYSLVEDVSYSPAALVGMVGELPNAGPPRGRTVLVNSGPATPFVALTFGTEGAAVCVIGPC